MLLLKKYEKKKGGVKTKTVFPRRESNPGHGGESAGS